MKHFEIREAAKILDLTEERIRACLRAGILRPRRGPRRTYQLSFQDLALLRTTKGLLDSGVPARRISKLLGSLGRQLGDDAHLSSLSIQAEGSHVVVTDGSTRWEPASGQFLLDLGAPPAPARTPPLAIVPPEARGPEPVAERAALPIGKARARRAAASELDASQWFERALELEGESREEARQAYHRALELDPTLADAHVNLGRQYHETEEYEKAEAHYRAGAEHAPEDPVVWFNLGVLEEDRDRPHQAIACYRRALERDPDYADAHHNLGLVLDALGRRPEAMTHLMKARAQS